MVVHGKENHVTDDQQEDQEIEKRVCYELVDGKSTLVSSRIRS
jgi:hypothetical protein